MAAARMLAEATMGTRRHSARLPPYVPFKLFETSPRKLFNVRKRRKGPGKKPKKPIKVAPDDDYYLDFPFSSIASRLKLFSAVVPSATSLEPVPASEQATDPVDNAESNNAAIAHTASQSGSFSADGPLTTSLGLVPAGEPATITAGNVVPDHAIMAQAIPSKRDPDRSRRLLQNNLEGAEAMQRDALLFKEALRLDRRLSRNNLGQNMDKGKTKNSRIQMKPKHRTRVRARSQSVIAMQLGMGLGPHFPPTPTSSRHNTPDLTAGPPTRENTPAPGPMSGPLMLPDWEAPTPVPTRQNTPKIEDGSVAGPSMHPGALEWRELTPVPTRPNTPQFEPGPSAPLGSWANPVRLDMIEEEPMDIDMEFEPSK
ncbi:hypothetical protein IW261DRAFT_460936 [Armillaria novae-zelandiae]|uniref:Uncharacterized protein n=1 Tax=Armillaria novae-zelandiae TaxID=153914 RepID=A0AA39P1I2_9AGAR|nr:hypothetical protein IW261DRAFT_460936 [Armillaria novae-zelandiae]